MAAKWMLHAKLKLKRATAGVIIAFASNSNRLAGRLRKYTQFDWFFLSKEFPFEIQFTSAGAGAGAACSRQLREKIILKKCKN